MPFFPEKISNPQGRFSNYMNEMKPNNQTQNRRLIVTGLIKTIIQIKIDC